ncbi:MAG: hypothetical protein FWD50_01810 [Betaproteobacteria bacterium]|nr:hypothetical protein [Betaproteobacteria bacterium]
MSYYSFFGAYAVSAESHDFLADVAGANAEFHGCSRSEAFQKACKALLDFLPGHDLLRFLSDESAPHKVPSPGGGLFNFTPIEPGSAKFYVNQLDDLLLNCRNRPEELAALWSDYGGYPTEDVVSALCSSKICVSLNSESVYGDDGDDPYFFFATLTTLQAAVTRVCSTGRTLVFYSWQGG